MPCAVAHPDEREDGCVCHCVYGEGVNVNANDDDDGRVSDCRRYCRCWTGPGPERVKAPGPFLGLARKWL